MPARWFFVPSAVPLLVFRVSPVAVSSAFCSRLFVRLSRVAVLLCGVLWVSLSCPCRRISFVPLFPVTYLGVHFLLQIRCCSSILSHMLYWSSPCAAAVLNSRLVLLLLFVSRHIFLSCGWSSWSPWSRYARVYSVFRAYVVCMLFSSSLVFYCCLPFYLSDYPC